MKRQIWTAQQLQYLQDNYSNVKSSVIAQFIGVIDITEGHKAIES